MLHLLKVKLPPKKAIYGQPSSRQPWPFSDWRRWPVKQAPSSSSLAVRVGLLAFAIALAQAVS